MLSLMNDRAEKLKKGKYQDVEAIQERITETKTKNLEELMRPTLAFIIFKDQKSIGYF